MKPSIEKITKFFKLETDREFDNKAVMGGLSSMLGSWEAEARADGVEEDLIKAITQASQYIFEVEREANSVKFLDRVDGVRVVKPRCVLVFGRSRDWNNEQIQAYRILNAGYAHLSVMTYDHVLERAKRMVGIDA